MTMNKSRSSADRYNRYSQNGTQFIYQITAGEEFSLRTRLASPPPHSHFGQRHGVTMNTDRCHSSATLKFAPNRTKIRKIRYHSSVYLETLSSRTPDEGVRGLFLGADASVIILP